MRERFCRRERWEWGLLIGLLLLAGCPAEEGQGPDKSGPMDSGTADSGCEEGTIWCSSDTVRASCENGEVFEEPCIEGQFCEEGSCFFANCDTIEEGYCLIPEGTFAMGYTEDDFGFDLMHDLPSHEVTITLNFLMKAKEVTQGEWEEMFGNNPSVCPACGPDCPVDGPNWWGALAYCNALSELAGLESCYEMTSCNEGEPGGDPALVCKEVSFLGLDCEGYRLPTEAEWEYAARAGTITELYSGHLTNLSICPNVDEVAWYIANSAVSYEGCWNFSDDFDGPTGYPDCAGIQPVGLKRPNQWGLYDILGNSPEWAWDWSSYAEENEFNPSGEVDPLGPGIGEDRVIRGCGFGGLAADCCSTSRGGGDPDESRTGFRPVRTVE